jgi:hypothetical protein
MEKGAAVDAAISAADEEGLPVFDRVLETPWKRGKSVEADYDALFDRIGPGRNYMALHFNVPGEIAAIEAPDSVRPEEYAHFRSKHVRDRLMSDSIELIGMRGLRDELRRGPYAATSPDSPLSGGRDRRDFQPLPD